jgi:diguanylate cyclase
VTEQQPQHRQSGWFELVPITLASTLVCLAFGLALNYLLLFSDALTPLDRSLITAVTVPILVGAPLSFMLAWSMQKAKIFRRALTRAASYDPGTEVLNGNVFSSMVERRAQLNSGDPQGAFLVVDVQGVKALNMRHGLEWGQEALRLIAAAIASAVREEDLVGRLGTDEFGIFLPGASEQNAHEIAQRVLGKVGEVYLTRGANSSELVAVNVAGVHFESAFEFDGMYRAAEERLSQIEQRGVVEVGRVKRKAAAGISSPVAFDKVVH